MSVWCNYCYQSSLENQFISSLQSAQASRWVFSKIQKMQVFLSRFSSWSLHLRISVDNEFPKKNPIRSETKWKFCASKTNRSIQVLTFIEKTFEFQIFAPFATVSGEFASDATSYELRLGSKPETLADNHYRIVETSGAFRLFLNFRLRFGCICFTTFSFTLVRGFLSIGV